MSFKNIGLWPTGQIKPNYCLSAHGFSGEPAGCPGGLKIESAGQTINVEQFASEKQTRTFPAFHGLEVHFAQSNATAGDELILVESFPRDLNFGRAELPDQPVPGRAGKAGPPGFAWDACGQDKRLPEPCRKRRDRSIGKPTRTRRPHATPPS